MRFGVDIWGPPVGALLIMAAVMLMVCQFIRFMHDMERPCRCGTVETGAADYSAGGSDTR